MLKNNLDCVIDRKNTNSIKWQFVQFMYPEVEHEVLPLWVADMDFSCAQPILDALHARVDREIFGYSSFDEKYYDAVTGWFKRRHKWEIEKNDIFFSPGIVPALGLLVRGLTKEGEGVIIQQPVYYPFMNMIKNNGRTIVNNTLVNKDGYYEMDYDDLEKKAQDPNNKLMLLCSPHNPVGRVWTKEELIRVHEICEKNGVLLISDEIHCDLLRDGMTHIPFHTLGEGAKKNTIVCTAPSKSFNLAGMQLSNLVISNPALQKKWSDEIKEKLSLAIPSPFAIEATIAAYNKSEEWLNQVNSYIDENHKFLKEYIENNLPKLTFTIPEGTYLAWVGFENYGLSNEELKKTMLYKANIALDDGILFGESGGQYQRINVACPQSILKEALDKIKTAMEG
ncbi:MAG: MalY/PatB family protein [Fusobacteriaceae bacterium]